MNFTFLNIPVYIQPTFWLFLLFFSNFYKDPSIESLIVALVMIVSLLVHEYGHAITAVFFGARPTITLEGLGGKAEFNNRGISAKQDLIITIMGPLLESLLIVIPYYLLKSGVFAFSYYLSYILYATMHVNILWCLLNLLPVEPLDGSRILRYFLDRIFGNKGYKISLIIGLICVCIAAPYLYLNGYSFFPILLLFLGMQSYIKLSQLNKQNEVSPFSLLMKGIEAEKNHDFDEAKMNYKKLIKSHDTQIKHSAIESLATIYFNEGEKSKSYSLLLKADPHYLSIGKNLLCKLAFENNNHEIVAKYAHEIYSLQPTFETAILNSQAYACLEQPELAGGWLATASKFGIEYDEKAKEVLKNAMYDSVRERIQI